MSSAGFALTLPQALFAGKPSIRYGNIKAGIPQIITDQLMTEAMPIQHFTDKHQPYSLPAFLGCKERCK